MAKGARATSIKTNHTALKKKVFGPVEDARTERLSAKLLALASQPKAAKEDVGIETQKCTETDNDMAPPADAKDTDDMEIDKGLLKSKTDSKSSRGRIEKKRNVRKASIVFPKYKNGKRAGNTKTKK